MADEKTSERLRRVLMAGACGLLLCFTCAASAYAEDDDDTFEQKIIKNILGGLGVDVGRSGWIDYRERSPLVVPPSNTLPPPQSNTAATNPAWPKEQKKKQAAARENFNANPEEPGSSSRLTPDEMRRGARPGGKITDPSQSGSVEEPLVGQPLKPTELGSSKFGWNMLYGAKAEQAPFTGEPARSSLTQPPSGYQTPSPAAPYGVGQDSLGGWQIPNILSRPEGPNGGRDF